MVNRTTGRSPFRIVYTKFPNFSVDLLVIPVPKSKAANSWAKNCARFYQEIREHIEMTNVQYKFKADKHRKAKQFQVGDLVMVHLNKQRMPSGSYTKLQPHIHGPSHFVEYQ